MSQGETGGIVLKVQDQIVSALAYVRAQNPSLAECGPDFLRRLEAHFPALLTELSALYGARDDFLDALGGPHGAAERVEKVIASAIERAKFGEKGGKMSL